MPEKKNEAKAYHRTQDKGCISQLYFANLKSFQPVITVILLMFLLCQKQPSSKQSQNYKQEYVPLGEWSACNFYSLCC